MRHGPPASKPLTVEEERDLFARYKAGDRSARDAIVRANIAFAHQVTRRLRVDANSDRYADVLAGALQGMAIAIERFEPERGFRFLTYASQWMRRCAIDAFGELSDETGTMPCGKRERSTAAAAAQAAASVGDPRAAWALHQDAGSLATSLALLDAKAPAVRLDATPFDESDETNHNSLATAEPSHESSVEREDLRAKIREALARAPLGRRLRRVIEARFLEDEALTLDAIGREFGVSKERVRQLEAEALEILRPHLAVFDDGIPTRVHTARETKRVDREAEALDELVRRAELSRPRAPGPVRRLDPATYVRPFSGAAGEQPPGVMIDMPKPAAPVPPASNEPAKPAEPRRESIPEHQRCTEPDCDGRRARMNWNSLPGTETLCAACREQYRNKHRAAPAIALVLPSDSVSFLIDAAAVAACVERARKCAVGSEALRAFLADVEASKAPRLTLRVGPLLHVLGAVDVARERLDATSLRAHAAEIRFSAAAHTALASRAHRYMATFADLDRRERATRSERVIDLAGQRFGRLMVERRDTTWTGRTARWICRCDCGTVRVVDGRHLRCGSTRSCGCLARDTRVANGHLAGRPTTHRQSGTPEYTAWKHMIARCTNPDHPNFSGYGGRGIAVCERWTGREGFTAFFGDMGPRPTKKHSLGRCDVNGNYEPGNCRWTTARERQQNTRSIVRVTCDGETLRVAEWAQRLGVHPETLRRRMVRQSTTYDAVIAQEVSRRRIAESG